MEVLTVWLASGFISSSRGAQLIIDTYEYARGRDETWRMLLVKLLQERIREKWHYALEVPGHDESVLVVALPQPDGLRTPILQPRIEVARGSQFNVRYVGPAKLTSSLSPSSNHETIDEAADKVAELYQEYLYLSKKSAAVTTA